MPDVADSASLKDPTLNDPIAFDAIAADVETFATFVAVDPVADNPLDVDEIVGAVKVGVLILGADVDGVVNDGLDMVGIFGNNGTEL